jgi:hypothetical protein
MYIKEDLIIPHVSHHLSFSVGRLFQCISQHHTFYDFIINKARGKSGPLFNFDVHDDIRLLADATKEKDESHAGKVVERSWYQRFKHIFPASRWEVSKASFLCPYYINQGIDIRPRERLRKVYYRLILSCSYCVPHRVLKTS